MFKIKSDSQFTIRCDDKYDIYATVVKLCTFRVMLTVSNKKKYPIHQIDAQEALLNGEIYEEVNMLLLNQTRDNYDRI